MVDKFGGTGIVNKNINATPFIHRSFYHRHAIGVVSDTSAEANRFDSELLALFSDLLCPRGVSVVINDNMTAKAGEEARCCRSNATARPCNNCYFVG